MTDASAANVFMACALVLQTVSDDPPRYRTLLFSPISQTKLNCVDGSAFNAPTASPQSPLGVIWKNLQIYSRASSAACAMHSCKYVLYHLICVSLGLDG